MFLLDFFVTMICQNHLRALTESESREPYLNMYLCIPNETTVNDALYSGRRDIYKSRCIRLGHCVSKKRFATWNLNFFLKKASEDKVNELEYVDATIRGKIPPESDPELWEVILEHFIHSPCEELNASAVCMVMDNKSDRSDFCSKHFPNPPEDEPKRFEMAHNVNYKRRDIINRRKYFLQNCLNNETSDKRIIDNSWVVPYNPMLSRQFQCHLNVELCSLRVREIKYLFKYISKGRDEETAELSRTNFVTIKFLLFKRHAMYLLLEQFDDYLKMDKINFFRPWCIWTFICQIDTLCCFKKVKNVPQQIGPNADPSYPNGLLRTKSILPQTIYYSTTLQNISLGIGPRRSAFPEHIVRPLPRNVSKQRLLKWKV